MQSTIFVSDLLAIFIYFFLPVFLSDQSIDRFKIRICIPRYEKKNEDGLKGKENVSSIIGDN